MTLIVGLIAKDGVVIGADSAATLGPGFGMRTIAEHSVQKIHNIHGRVLLATSGPVGLSYIFASILAPLVQKNEFTRKYTDVDMAQSIRDCIYDAWKDAIEKSNFGAQKLNDGHLLENGRLTAVVGFKYHEDKKFGLAEFMADGTYEVKRAALPFVSIGSGQMTADPFLSYTVKLVKENGELTLERATLAAVWTLQHAIDCTAGGLAEPIHISRIEGQAAGGLVAKDFTEGEVGEVVQMVTEVEGKIAKTVTEIASAVKAPPTPPAATKKG